MKRLVVPLSLLIVVGVAAPGLAGQAQKWGPPVQAITPDQVFQLDGPYPGSSRMWMGPEVFYGAYGQPFVAYPDGQELPTPHFMRFWRYSDEDSIPQCADLPDDAWIKVFSKTFDTKDTTSYIMILFSGMGVVPAVPSNYDGIGLRCSVTQGPNVLPCPNAGEDGLIPLFIRRDLQGHGEANYSSYVGIVMLDPLAETDNEVTVDIEMRYRDPVGGSALGCHTNLMVLYN